MFVRLVLASSLAVALSGCATLQRRSDELRTLDEIDLAIQLDAIERADRDGAPSTVCLRWRSGVLPPVLVERAARSPLLFVNGTRCRFRNGLLYAQLSEDVQRQLRLPREVPAFMYVVDAVRRLGRDAAEVDGHDSFVSGYRWRLERRPSGWVVIDREHTWEM